MKKTNLLRLATTAAGLAVLVWVGLGYWDNNPLALLVTALIACFYAMGVHELIRYEQATQALLRALAGLTDPPAQLQSWLAELPVGLQNAVRRRVEGAAVGLPGPALAPTLAGLTVLLGMLGTFIGMVLTLSGTGAALESALDLLTMRSALVGPVKGLGLAFGTSVAGVAASAALGLLTALCRRERVQAAQRLDAAIGSHLQAFSPAHQRQESLALQQAQAAQMPALLQGLQALMSSLERQAELAHERQLASQSQFHAQAQASYRDLALSLDQTLQTSVTASSQKASESLQALASSTLGSIAAQTQALHQDLAAALAQQQAQLGQQLQHSSASMASTCQTLLERQESSAQALIESLSTKHQQFADTFAQAASTLIAELAQRQVSWHSALTAALADLRHEAQVNQGQMGDAVNRHLGGVSQGLEATVQTITQAWQQALSQQAQVSSALSQDNQQALQSISAQLASQGQALLQAQQQAQAELQTRAAQQEQARAQALSQTLGAMAADPTSEWRAAGAQTLAGQQSVCDTLARTAHEISSQAQIQTRDTCQEINKLLHAAEQAPRAAADMVASLRQQLSDSLARDQHILEERARILSTLSALVDGMSQQASEQRQAIDSLVSASKSMLSQAAEHYSVQLQQESAQLKHLGGELGGSAAEVASLGESFGLAVRLFCESNERLGQHLQSLDSALDKAMVRSDEQLGYYVAQAREVIDLSVLSQKQIIESLQGLAQRQAPAELSA